MGRTKRWISAGLLLAAPAAAQQAAPTATVSINDRAIAAGYKASMLCSGIFNAGRTRAQVEALELTGIYPDYASIVPTLEATVDPVAGAVSVAYDPSMPPRRAEWSTITGCTTLPPGAEPPPPIRYTAAQQFGYRAPSNFQQPDPRPWPMGDGGIAPNPDETLSEVVDRAFEKDGFAAGDRTTGVVILRDGRIVAERYGHDFGPFTSNRTWSVAKSVAGTLVGIASLRGKADVAAPAPVPEWGLWPRYDRRRTITLDNLLRMGSGLHSDSAGNRTDAIYFGGTAVTDQATGWPLATLPGTRFRYANNDTLLAVRSLRQSLGEEAYRYFPKVALFDAIGMRHTVAERDWRGNYILSSQLWSTARDLARLGLLWSQDGVWQGERLLPEGWVRYMTTPSGPQPEQGAGYGATLWLFGPEQGLPAGSYAAQGNRGQYVMVVPSHRLVIVRRGEDMAGKGFDIAAFAAAVVEASR